MIFLDGPMGTELSRRGVATPAPGWSAHANETAPEVVVAVHDAYARAGANVHRTNTFRTQPHFFPERWRSLADAAVTLARRGAPGGRIAGSVAPHADCYRPDLSPAEDVARRAHRALAEALASFGVDALVCETFPHAGEARVAVEEAARTGLPTWIALTAGPDAALMSPEAMERAARDCVAAGAEAALVCCTRATATLAYVERLARIGCPIGAYANAGPESDGLGWAEDPRAAERYADLAARWVDAGATIVGACCGTGPAHVAAVVRRLS